MTDVAVVIPNWNSLGHLKRCLDSLADQTEEIELMVVDNGSSDGSIEWLRRHEIPSIPLAENRGFAEAVNRGVAATAAPLILVLNADAILAPGCLGRLVERMPLDSDIGGVQPLILQDDAARTGELPGSQLRPAADTRVYSAGQALTRDGRAYEIAQGEPLSSLNLAPGEVFGVCGAACLLNRRLFEQLNGYDETYFSFYEDVDLNMRGRVRGWRFEIEPEAVAWHVGNAIWQAEFNRPAAANARLVARNRLATQIKFMPPGLAPLIVLVECGALLRAIMQRRIGATLRGKLGAMAQWRRLLRERRRLRASGDLGAARLWLGDAR